MKQVKFNWGGVNFSFLKTSKMLTTVAIGLCLVTSGANAQSIIDVVTGGVGSDLLGACTGETLDDNLPVDFCGSMEIPLHTYNYIHSNGFLEWKVEGAAAITNINGRSLQYLYNNYLQFREGGISEIVYRVRYVAVPFGNDKLYLNNIEYIVDKPAFKSLLKPYVITIGRADNSFQGSAIVNVTCSGFNLSKDNITTCGDLKSDKQTFRIKSNVDQSAASITVSGKADCYTGMKFEVSAKDNVSTYWSWGDGNKTSDWGSGIYISNYNSPGVKTISVTRVSECATITGTTTVTVPRPPDLVYLENNVEVPKTFGLSNEIDLNCNKTQYGTLLGAKNDKIGGSAVFKWYIPSTWVATNAGAKKGEYSENNISYDIYEGVWQNTLYVKQKADAPNQINGGQFWAKVTTCSTEVDVVINQNKDVKRLTVKSKQPYTVEAQDLGSCVSDFQINPVINGSFKQPISLTWETNAGVGFFTTRNTTYSGSGTGAASYTSQVGGFQPVKASGVDLSGCVSLNGPSASSNGYQYSSIRVGVKGEYAAGWNRGVLPTVPQTVPVSGGKIINLQGSVYYIGTNGKGYYYSFSNAAGQWLINPISGITNGKASGNSLAVSTRGAVLYYLNNVGSISSIATPYNSGASSAIVQGTAGAVGSLEVENTVGNPNRGTLYFRGANNYIYKYNPATDAQASVFVAENTVYDIRAYNGRVFYITQINGNPQLKYRDIGTSTSTVIYSGTIWRETEIEVNASGDVFFVANSRVNYVAKTTTGYAAPVTLPITFGYIQANGNLTVNQSTGTVYWAGDDTRIYINFIKDGVWKVNSASDSQYDFAGMSLYYATPNLLYVNSSGIIYNLYYFPECPPNQFRKGDIEEVSLAESSLKGQLYPNPFQDVLEVNVQGQGEATLELTDLTGRVVSSTPYYFTPTQLATSSLHKGIYLCRVVQDGKQVFVTKVQK
jgi:hypothetical protein